MLVAILIGGASLMFYVDPPSVMIVIGGATAAMLVAYPLPRILALPGIIMKTVFTKPTDTAELIETLVRYAEVARRDGILSLESMASEMEDPLIVRGIQMAVDGTDPELIEEILETELENQIQRHKQGKALLEGVGKYAPALGMIGTLIGLVAMLADMEDPSAIGAGMAAALLTTLYGALIANLLFLPMADKLGERASEEVLTKTIIMQGVMSIQVGDNPRIVQQKLLTYVPPGQRAGLEDEDEDRAAA